MSGNGEHNVGRLRPPVHPTRSSAAYSTPSSPANSTSRPPIHPSHPSAQLSTATLGPNLPSAPPPHPSASLSPALPPRPTGASPQISQLPPSGFTSAPEEPIAQPPSLPPRHSPPSPYVPPPSGLSSPGQQVLVEEDQGDQGSDAEVGAPATTVLPGLGAGPSTDTLSSIASKDEEELSEVQLRELYDDEDIDRFLKVFSTVSFHTSSGRPSAQSG